jgi:chemotaxis protein methyltransferase CheR
MVSALSASARDTRVEDIELQLLLEALLRLEGYDYRGLDPSHIKRRVAERLRSERLDTISALQDRVLHDEAPRNDLLVSLGVGPRDLLFDPEFFVQMRLCVLPLLQTYSFVRVWLPASGNGEEAYALACLLQEAGLLGRCVIYATSLSHQSVNLARAGAYTVQSKAALRAAFANAGFGDGPQRYGDLEGRSFRFNDDLRQSIMFAQHHVGADASINEFHAILARRLLPIFNAATQYDLHRMFYDSLARLGFLCLGHGETLAGTVHERAYRRVSASEPIYRRMR